MAIFSESGELRSGQLARTATGLVIALPFILSNWFRYDFRADLDRVELLLGLPLSPRVMALGQVLVPALLLTILQTAGLLFVLPSVDSPHGDAPHARPAGALLSPEPPLHRHREPLLPPLPRCGRRRRPRGTSRRWEG